MDNLWRIVANASQVVNDWERSWQFPTFYVHASSEEEAAKVATRVLDPHRQFDLYLSVLEMAE